MGHHYTLQPNGGGGPGWSPPPAHGPQPPPAQPARGGLFDLAKGGLPLTLIAGAFLVVLQAGMAIGTYQERGANMGKQLDELKADVREIKAVLPELKAAVKDVIPPDLKAAIREIAARPPAQWTMHVEGRR